MSIEARVTRVWRNQRIFLFLLLLGFSAAFFFDGAVRYPRLNNQYAIFKEYEGKGDVAGWQERAKKEGWNTKAPEKHHSIREQYVFAGIMGVLGLFALAYWFSHKDRFLRLTDTEVFTPNGKVIPLTAITGIGKKKWDSKGLATVRYEVNGQRGQFIVDDYKFEPKPTRGILEGIEQNLLARTNPATNDLSS